MTYEEDEITEILRNYRNVAVVGLSRDPNKDSYEVADYLKSKGYKIIPINPFADEILGERCYKSLLDLPDDIKRSIEIVDIFRPSKEVLPIVEQALQLRRKYGRPFVIWMQLGIVNQNAAKMAKDEGMKVVMNKCMKIELKDRRNLKALL
ncbi:MAG: CoA-binding protein [archaeon]|nr:CoA-binding protein [archaeon]